MNDLITGRMFLRSDGWDEWRDNPTDQKSGVPAPPLEKPFPPDARLIDLVAPQDLTLGAMSLRDAIARRKTRRAYSSASLSLAELSFLLWATQGVKEIVSGGQATRRVVPSGGARHPFETYLYVQRVETLSPGLYRYLAIEHKLILVSDAPDGSARMNQALRNQGRDSAVIFAWTAFPYRTEWRYTFLAHKLILLDAGHVCQNLYLACEAIDAGTCAIDAYNQTELDELLGVDGKDELAVYCATVGRVVG